MSALDVPCRVSADLNRYLREQEEPREQEFDEWDEDQFKQFLPSELVKPVQRLLLLRRDINSAERIGGLNKDRALAAALDDLDELYSACKSRFYDL